MRLSFIRHAVTLLDMYDHSCSYHGVVFMRCLSCPYLTASKVTMFMSIFFKNWEYGGQICISQNVVMDVTVMSVTTLWLLATETTVVSVL